MPSSYTERTRLEKIATGEQGGSWGDATNKNFDRLDIAINGIATQTITSSNTSSGAAASLNLGTSVADETGRHQMIIINDSGDIGGGGYVQLGESTSEKVCIIRNSLSNNRALFVFQGTYNSNNDLVVPNGKDVLVKFDGGGSGAIVELALKNAYFVSVETTSDMTVGGNINVTGDITIADDGLKTATNTSGHILVNNGTNFNPVAVSGDVTISSAGAVTIANDAVTNDMIAANAVDTAQIVNDSINSDKLSANSVTSSEILNDAVTSAKIAADAVTTTEIADGAVTADKIAANAVGSSEIAANAVGSSEIAADAVTASEIAANAVGTSEIAADAVTAAEIAANAVGTSEIADGAVTTAKINTAATIRKVDTAGNGSGWTVEASSTDLHFKYNGTTVISFESSGKGVFKNDLVAFDSTP